MSPSVSYDFLAPRKIVFGWGRRTEIGQHCQALGRRAFLVNGSPALETALEGIAASLRTAGLETVRLPDQTREPLVEDVDAAVRLMTTGHQAKPGDFVLALGGGSAIDLAKAVAGLSAQPDPGTVVDYLEGVGKGRKLTVPTFPVVAMPTTAGTGAEATRNTVISSKSPSYKKSLRADGMMPALVLVDPELAVGLPKTVTAYSGMDAITQLIESYISCRATAATRRLSAAGLVAGWPALKAAYDDGTNRAAREAMADAALLSGMALANSGLGIAHGIAAAMGVLHGIPHGLACATLLPLALRANAASARKDLAFLARSIGVAPSGSSDQPDESDVTKLEDAVRTLCRHLEIPERLSDLGIRSTDLPALVEGSHGNSRSGNPHPITDSEVQSLLEQWL